MAIEYINDSYSFNFNPAESCLILTFLVKAKNTLEYYDTQYYQLHISKDGINIEELDPGESYDNTIDPCIRVTNKDDFVNYKVIYKDYTAAPSQFLEYKISGVFQPTLTFSYIFTHDDLLLSTDTQVLNIKYNPDITSMKITTGDAITQTLGSKYPYFRRNGIMNYKQFNIGGLISYHEDNAFWSAPDLTGYDLSEADIERVKEKQFRDAVLDFLYDSKPKILKSTTEGCMIVKLTNISLTPNKQLGRSIYSFTAQATEYCEPTIDNLVKYRKDFEGEVVIDV